MKEEIEELASIVKSKQEKLILQTLLENFEQIPKMNLEQIANISFCSKTSVRRVVIKLGYKGYLEYQLHVTLELKKKESENHQAEIYNLDSEKYDLIVQMVKNAKRVTIIGIGSDAIAAQYFYRQLIEKGYNISLITEVDLLHSAYDELVVLISNYGYISNLQKNLKALKEAQKCKLIALTRANSDIVSYANFSICHNLEYSSKKGDIIDVLILMNSILKFL